MTTELSLFSPNSLENKLKVAEVFIKSKALKKCFDSPESVLVTCTLGADLGFTDSQSLQLLSISNGQVTLTYNGYLAVMCNAGGWTKEVKCDEKEAVVEIHRPGREPYTTGFSIAEASKAGLLGKDTWQKYPRKMLLSSAIKHGIRQVFADRISGLYEEEEMEAVTSVEAPKRGRPPKAIEVVAEHVEVPNVPAIEAPKAKPSTIIEVPVEVEPVADAVFGFDEPVAAPKTPFDASNGDHQSALLFAHDSYFEALKQDKKEKMYQWAQGKGLFLEDLDVVFKEQKAKREAAVQSRKDV